MKVKLSLSLLNSAVFLEDIWEWRCRFTIFDLGNKWR
jgi:hypothetical protein